MSELQRIGSSKIIRPIEPGVVSFEFTNRWSAFDVGSSLQEIPPMGKARCACAVESFRRIEDAGVETHFLRQVKDNVIHVREFTIPGHEPLSGSAHGNVIPLEVLTRSVAAGSMLKRIAQGESPTAFGFPEGTVVTKGMPLPKPLVEFTTKFGKVDRHLSEGEAQALARLDDHELRALKELNLRAFRAVSTALKHMNFDHWDGKQEWARHTDGRFIMVDCAGTPDEDRIVEMSTGDLHCKDVIRLHLDSLPWKAQLDEAKATYPDDKSKWPPYPELPDSVVDEVISRYGDLAWLYAGVKV